VASWFFVILHRGHLRTACFVCDFAKGYLKKVGFVVVWNVVYR
jgi:hypothetical protein